MLKILDLLDTVRGFFIKIMIRLKPALFNEFLNFILISEFLWQVFMVLRKKQSHISFLHVYHHAGMVPLAWGAVSYYPGEYFFKIILDDSEVQFHLPHL